MRRIAACLATVLLMGGAAAARDAAATRNTAMAIPLDQVRVVTFAEPISTLYVGNPVIADVTMIDKRHAFVQGKAFGATNLVALDAAGHEINNRQVVVFGDSASLVTLQRGTGQVTYSCVSTRCEPSPQPGDDKDAFGSAMSQIAQHQDLLTKTASSQ
ncbi:MAG: pilus assembly protein N-terminal domain-containing protein [Alphaproteobacteria bacterium]|nr:pilus assembly protein N-terminal domain-containing protein [Alphaproteobacteria bacterium]MDE2493304.1 pilus assembly protein N-terminal domain-containing protein [Alphaproteobacteria bacterium]